MSGRTQTLLELKRFDPDFDSYGEIPNGQSIVMEPDENGDWVRYKDIADLLYRLAHRCVKHGVTDCEDCYVAALSQPEHQGDEYKEREVAPDEVPSAKELDAQIHRFAQPPAPVPQDGVLGAEDQGLPVLSDEERERLNEIADELDRLVDSREDIIQSPLSTADFLRNLASRDG